jgi:hypothetical protein
MNCQCVSDRDTDEIPMGFADDDSLLDEEGLDEQEDVIPLDNPYLPPRRYGYDYEGKNAGLEPDERIARLFGDMYPYRQNLLAIIAACKEASSFERVTQALENVMQGGRSVFAADNYLNMLVDAGALEAVTADGEPYVGIEAGPQEVERDGGLYLVITEPPTMYWRTTEAGLKALAQNDRLAELKNLFAERETLRPAFAVLLRLCAREGGADINKLKEAINERPEVVEKKKTAQFLLDYLSNAGAVYYDSECKGWRTNDTGDAALRMLGQVEG